MSAPNLTNQRKPTGFAEGTQALLMEMAEHLQTEGRTLRRIETKGLWKLKRDDTGGQKYGSFKAFCEGELSFSFEQVLFRMEASTKDARELSLTDILLGIGANGHRIGKVTSRY